MLPGVAAHSMIIGAAAKLPPQISMIIEWAATPGKLLVALSAVLSDVATCQTLHSKRIVGGCARRTTCGVQPAVTQN